MKIALLLRGFHHLEHDRFGFPLDARKLVPNLIERVLQPLRQQHSVKVFAVSYPSPIQDEVFALLQPDHLSLLESSNSSQIKTFRHGLAEIQKHPAGPFERIIATRFDLLYLKPVLEWDI